MNELTAFLKTRKKANLAIVAINVLVFIVFSIIGNTEDAQFMLTQGACFAPLVKEGEVYQAFYSDVSALWSGASDRKYAASDFSRRYTGAGSRFRSLSVIYLLGGGRKCALLLYRALPEELCSVGRRFRSTVCGDRGVGISCTEKKGRCRGNFRKKAAFDGSSFDRPGIYRGWN